jgi:hypothetical protein
MKERQINRMWDVHFVDRQVQAALQRLFSHDGEPDASIVRLLEKRIASLSASVIKASLRRIDVQISCPIAIETQISQALEPSVRPERKVKSKTAESRPTLERGKKRSVLVSLADLIAAGLIHAPMEIFRNYKNTKLLATINRGGTVEFGVQRFDSCSTAGSYARGSIVGGRPATNGWSFWRFVDADGSTHNLDFVRQSYLASRE